MSKKVGVKFKSTGKIYDFSCGAFVLNPGDHVIVETEQGLGMGTVTVGPQEQKDQSSGKPLKKVYRLANENDFKQNEKNLADENEAHSYCLNSIRNWA
jgi:cell fate regulator YaaT (PSP1 superfamily)